MRFSTSFLITLLFSLGIVVIDKGAGFIILRIIQDPDTKGRLDQLLNVAPILMSVSNLGLATSLVYFTRRREVSIETAGQTTSAVAIVWGLTVAVLAYLVIQLWAEIDRAFDVPPWTMLLPVLATAPFLLLISYRNSIQLVLQRIVGYNLVHLAPSVSYLPLFIVLYYLVPGERDPYHSGAYAKFVPAVLIAVALIWVLRAEVPIRPRLDPAFFKRALSFGWRANLNSTLTVLNHRIDLYYVSALSIPLVAGVTGALTSSEELAKLRAAQVGYYSLAVTLAELIWYVPEAMRDLLFARVAGSSQSEARAFTPVVCRNSLWICAAGGLAVWLLHDPVLDLWLGQKTVDGQLVPIWREIWAQGVTPALAMLLPGTMCFTVAKVLQADLAARGHVNACVVFSSIVFVSMSVIDVFTIPAYGALGAAIGSTVAYVLGAAATIWFYRREAQVSLVSLLVPQRSDLVYYKGLLKYKGLRKH